MNSNLLLPILFTTALTNGLGANDLEPALPFERLQADTGIEGNLSLGWESRYFSEGRDSLDGDSLITSSLEIGFEHFSFGYWYGISPEQNYDELQLTAAYSNHLGDFDYYFSFTHFELSTVFPEREFDNEVGFGIAYTALPYDFGISLDAYYSFLEEGYFTEFTIDQTTELTDSLSLNAATTLGINQGYVSEGHDGLNHLAFSLGLEYSPREAWTISTHFTYSLPLERDLSNPDDESLIYFFHSGISVQWSF